MQAAQGTACPDCQKSSDVERERQRCQATMEMESDAKDERGARGRVATRWTPGCDCSSRGRGERDRCLQRVDDHRSRAKAGTDAIGHKWRRQTGRAIVRPAVVLGGATNLRLVGCCWRIAIGRTSVVRAMMRRTHGAVVRRARKIERAHKSAGHSGHGKPGQDHDQQSADAAQSPGHDSSIPAVDPQPAPILSREAPIHNIRAID
jgi:hypothetical protein